MRIQRAMLMSSLFLALIGCGDGGGVGGGGTGAGGTGAEVGITCDAFKEFLSDCFNTFCANQGASTAFCGCWVTGQDLNIGTCACMPLDLDPACGQVDLTAVDPAQLSCQPAWSALQNVCTG